jgi:hypothetical protein
MSKVDEIKIFSISDNLKMFSDTQKILDLCVTSRVEEVNEGDLKNKIYKYIGMTTLTDLEAKITDRFIQHFKTETVALYESPVESSDDTDYVVIFWYDNVLVVMVSNTIEQHNGEFDLYFRAALLLTQITNEQLISEIFTELKDED